MNIGIIGYHGRLGSQLVAMGCTPIDYNISSKLLLDAECELVINCAALTDVDKAEDNAYYFRCIKINGDGIENLAMNYHKEIIHISTDYVFGGIRGPYSEGYFEEDDLPTKKMSYGISKMLGEVLAEEYDHVHIVRTTGLYGGVSNKPDFLKKVLSSEKELKVTNELKGNQTYIPHLAEALIQYAEMKNKPKILHIASKEVISRYEFALMIADVYGLDKSKIIPCMNDEVPGWIAERPKNGGLKVDLAQKLGLSIYTIKEGLEASKDG